MNTKLFLAGLTLASSITFGAGPQFSIAPGIQFGATKYDTITNFSFNLLGAENQNMSGLDISLVGYRKINGNFSGVHFPIFGLEAFRVGGNMEGVSISLWNDIQGNLNGGTLGIVNTVGGDATFNLGGVNYVEGRAMVQLGFVNYSQSVGGIQLGFVNATQNLEGIQVGFVNYAANGILPVLPIINFRKSF